MARSANNRRNQDEKRTTGAMKPVSLSPVNLRTEQSREIESAPIEARETRLTTFEDSSGPAREIEEHRSSFSPLSEVRPDLKPESSINYTLQSITVSPMQMQDLRERRVAARDLGWVIPGHRIRIRS